MIRQKLIEKYKKFPLTPGVYLFIGKDKKPLYIGKATSLRRRVSQYITKSPAYGTPFKKEGMGRLDPRIAEMVLLAKDIKFYKTDSVLEAVILEANLIKKHWPKYNVKEKDDRSFIYIVIPISRGKTRKKESRKDAEIKWLQKVNFDYPAPVVVRGQQVSSFHFPPSSFYLFGPYQSQTIVNNALKIIRRIFPYSTCQPKKSPQPPFEKGTKGIRSLKKGQGGSVSFENGERGLNSFKKDADNLRACFNYQIGLCPGICIGAISKKDYQKNIKNIILLLSGKKKQLLKKLQQENPEKARALQHIQDVSLIQRDSEIENSAQRIEGYDISHLAGKETYGSMVVFENNEPNKNEYRLFKIKEAPANDDLRSLAEVIERRFKHPEWKMPDLIMIDGGIPQISYIQKVLDNLNARVPIVGISKYGGDELVFPLKAKKIEREEIKNLKNTLLKVRDEAHRFALKSSRHGRKFRLDKK